MAKRLREVHIDANTSPDGYWQVYVDNEFDEAIAKTLGVLTAFRLKDLGYLAVKPDPRYDWDELIKEIIELCR